MGKKRDLEYAAAIDLGGTKVLAAIVDKDHQVVAQAKVKTDVEGGPLAVIEQMAKGVRKAAKKADLKLTHLIAVGACAPGPVDPTTGIITKAVNLGWEEPIDLGQELSNYLDGIPVLVDNDVNAGVFGEVVAGAAQGQDDVIGIFVGTGIGGGIVLGGELRRGHRYSAGEIGHSIILADGPLCGCGNRGCIEAVASRTALERIIQAGLAAGRESVIPALMESNGNRMTSSVIAAAMEQEDALMKEGIDQMAYYLGLFAASLVNIVDPQMLVFGGGVVEKLGNRLLDPIRAIAQENYMVSGGVEIVSAQLSDYAGIIGAAALAREAHR